MSLQTLTNSTLALTAALCACSPPTPTPRPLPGFANLDREAEASRAPVPATGSPAVSEQFGVQDPSTPRLPLSDPREELDRTAEQELLLRSARNSVALEDWKEGITLFEAYLLQRPTDHVVRMEYAGLLVREGALGKARDAFEEVRLLRPDDMELRRRLADVLVIGGEYWAAMEELEAITTADPADVESAAMLVRVYTWVKDFERAQHIYDRHLRSLNPSDEQDQLLLAPVLLDMQRPYEALGHLERLHQRYPQELEWLTHLVLCYLQTGNNARAIQTVADMDKLRSDEIAPRIRLVDQLLLVKNYKLAMEVNQQVLEIAPKDPLANLMAARILLEAFDVTAARDALLRLEPEIGSMRPFQMALARYHQLVGNWVEAQGIYEGMLLSYPSDHEARLMLAILRREKGDLEFSKADLRKITMESPLGPRARVELANSLRVQGRNEEAASVCQSVLAQRPNYLEAVLGLVEAQLALEAFEQARMTCQRYIEDHANDTLAVAQAKLALAKTHLVAGNTSLATRLYREALQSPTAHTPEAFYGLSEARLRGGDRIEGAEVALMTSTIVASGMDIRLRLELAALALGDHNWVRAENELTTVLQGQPDNLVGQILLGECYNQKLKAGESADPGRIFRAILARNPSNSRARLGLARNYVIDHRFADAIKEYDTLVTHDSSYIYIGRERARALYWEREYKKCFKAYDELLAQLPTDAYPVDVFSAFQPGDGIRAGLDFEAELAISEAVRLERESKMYMGWRPERAAKALKELIVLEPANLEARFDLAQLYHRQGDTEQASRYYEEILDVTGGHKEASMALAGAERDIRPRFEMDFLAEDRDGRGGLALIKESTTFGTIFFPLGDAEDYLGVGFGQRRYGLPGGLPALTASVLRLNGSKRINDRTLLHGQFELPHYSPHDMGRDGDDPGPGSFDERLAFDLGLRYLTGSQMGINVNVFADQVAENSETIARDLHRTGARMGFTFKHNRKVDYGASLMFADYSDQNTRYDMNLFAAYEFSPAPKSLRVLTKVDLLDFSDESDFEQPEGGGDIDADTLAGLTTPYFAPKGYSIFSIQLDWRHEFGEQWFTGSPRMWYGTTGRVAMDANGAGYTELGVEAGYDFNSWLGLTFGTSAIRSSEIDVTKLGAQVVVRWP
ncbi:MAG: tetratricopeptide repeat protein [Planctomycetota bacterium]|jgi:tetratricopeptide (TPR) repeat protein|nr:tetratricopeptide repeat protein [Planctomycetota bacterium]MDP6989209.1 tetratricopeptide repeat protein [Planctomycetota bacterium]